jgi:hypothetical protein
MGTILTDPAGLQHITERNGATVPTNAFDALELGFSSLAPAIGDTRAALSAKVSGSIIQVSSGYPVLGDSDIRNDGRGALVYSWKFEYPEGAQLIASHAIVTNYDGGAPSATEALLVHADETTVKRADQVLTVFVNVSTTFATSFVAHVEDGTPLTEQMASWRSQSIALGGAPGASPVTNGIVQSRLSEGEQAWLGARLLNGEGGVMTRDDVAAVLLSAYKRDRERDWTLASEESLDVFAVMPSSPVRTDRRWRVTQGYNFAHAWLPPGGWGARRTRLEYSLTMLDSTTRTLVHEIEWQSVRSQ